MCYTLRQPASRRPPFAFLSQCACLNRVKSLKSSQPKLLNWSILFYLVKLFFSIASILLLITNGHNWARCTRRTAIRPGVENVFQQQAAHAAYSQQRSCSPPPPPPPLPKKKKFISIVLNFSWDDCNTQKK